MNYAKILGSECVQYPYTFIDLMKDNPYTEFGSNHDVSYWFPQTELGQQGYELVPVIFTPQPYYNHITKGLKELTPVKVDDVWCQVWEIYDLDPAQIELNRLNAKDENKAKASQLLLETDWVELDDVTDPQNIPYLMNKQEFKDYRQRLRLIVVNPPVIVEMWPIKPNAVWSDITAAQIGVDRV